MKCNLCGYEGSKEDFEDDYTQHKGAWCPMCDGFTYHEQDNEQRNHFKLLLEEGEKGKGKLQTVIHKPVSFPTQVSPLRWPGGKSKFVGNVLEHCDSENMVHFVEPFAGGASVGLSFLLAGKCRELYLNDIDFGVYALFNVIKNEPASLIERIRSFAPKEIAYKKAQKIVKSQYRDVDKEQDAAWSLLVVNRLAFSGIPKANCMKNPSARWNAKTLIKRIKNIHTFAEHIHISCMDACEYIEEMYWKPNTTIFIDPPFFNKGSVLYMNAYRNNDHEKLAFLLDELYKGMPGADMLVSYDSCEAIRSMYQYPEQEEFVRHYSIAN